MAMKVQVCACVCLHTRTFLNATDKGGIGGEDQTLLEPSRETKDPVQHTHQHRNIHTVLTVCILVFSVYCGAGYSNELRPIPFAQLTIQNVNC